MATTKDYAAFVCDCVFRYGEVRARKMFGEYMVYLNDRPILLVCDNTVFVKKLPEVSALLPEDAPSGYPYEGAKEMLLVEEVDNKEFLTELFEVMHDELPSPKRKNNGMR